MPRTRNTPEQAAELLAFTREVLAAGEPRLTGLDSAGRPRYTLRDVVCPGCGGPITAEELHEWYACINCTDKGPPGE